jgi:uncharacterized repeat protein (TIGR04138 family)
VENPLDGIIARDPRFKPEAYAFVHDALGHTWKRLKVRRHVSGLELLEGIRELALQNYGSMAKAVLNSWGVRSTDDLGAIVFNLVNAGLLSKTDEDRVEDFHAVYDFEDAFVRFYKIEDKKANGEE